MQPTKLSGQPNPQRGSIYVFDKGYVNYSVYKKWTEDGSYFVTRPNENAHYEKKRKITLNTQKTHYFRL